MYNIVRDNPIISNFLSNIPNTQHTKTIEQLILIGINVVSGAIHSQHQKQIPNCKSENIMVQIHKIKQQINHLAKKVQQTQPVPNNWVTFAKNQPTNPSPEKDKEVQEISNNHNIDMQRKQEINSKINEITPKVTETIPVSVEVDVRKRGTSRYHLDDHQLRQAMIHPIDSYEPQKKQHKDYSKHQYQQQINKQQLKALKNQQLVETKTNNMAPSHASSRKKTKSKIRTLIQRDRLKYQYNSKQDHYEQTLNKYQYSDDDDDNDDDDSQENQEDNLLDYEISNNKDNSRSELNKSYKKQNESFKQIIPNNNNKKLNCQNKQTKKLIKYSQPVQKQYSEQMQNNSEMDFCSNSSTFSQFSINGSSRRQVGKISRRK